MDSSMKGENLELLTRENCENYSKSKATQKNSFSKRRIHTKYNPYKCDQCHKGFTQSNQLKIHRRTHTEDKPYTCEQCHKRFAQSDSLKTHLRTHTGEMLFKCEKCQKSFTTSGSLNTCRLLVSIPGKLEGGSLV